MRILKKILGYLFLIPGIFLCFYPTFFWYYHPELSKMQIFLETANIFIPGLAFAFIGAILIGSSDKF